MANTIPNRSEINPADTWDLGSLYTSESQWEADFKAFSDKIARYSTLKGTLAKDQDHFKACLDFHFSMEETAERLSYYAFLKYAEDAGSSENQARQARVMQIGAKAEAEASFIAPEIQAIPEATLQHYINQPQLEEYRVYLTKLLRYKPHILPESEERLLALQTEAAQTAQKAFGSLTDVDMDFGTIQTPEGEIALSQSSFAFLLQHEDRSVRQKSFQQFYSVYQAHENTLANLYTGSIHQDIFRSKARKFESSLAAALFPDNVPETVYRNLIATVRTNLPKLHGYYALRKKILGLEDLHLYDTKVSLIENVRAKTSFNEAVDIITQALSPLGEEYSTTLRNGLLGGWVDRYENKGKRSGAFSAGSFHGNPYILMNYQETVLRDVFTLAHEGGHSMHSWYSSRNNPFPHYNYTIFEAEVASTFNEQLLFHHMMNQTKDAKMKAYLLNKQIDDILATLYRQTMFAEFELAAHEMAEAGNPVTLDTLRSTYMQLLKDYFGPEVVLEEYSDLEGLRIPHFYRAFYVYKYATGVSAAITLSQRVMHGGKTEREEYFSFLKSGGSQFPIDSLAVAGVDMSKPHPIQKALDLFSSYVDQLEQLLGEMKVS